MSSETLKYVFNVKRMNSGTPAETTKVWVESDGRFVGSAESYSRTSALNSALIMVQVDLGDLE